MPLVVHYYFPFHSAKTSLLVYNACSHAPLISKSFVSHAKKIKEMKNPSLCFPGAAKWKNRKASNKRHTNIVIFPWQKAIKLMHHIGKFISFFGGRGFNVVHPSVDYPVNRVFFQMLQLHPNFLPKRPRERNAIFV
jgi:hypothetical protein